MLDHDRIGTHLQHLRKRHQLTQTALAEQLGVTHQAVSKWENGDCLPDLETLLRLARLYACTVEQLLLVDSPGRAAEAGSSTGLKDEPSGLSDNPVYDDMTSLWEAALESMRSKMSGPSFNTWLSPVTAEFADGKVIIYCPRPFATDWLRARYTELITHTLEELTGEPELSLEFRTRLLPYATSPGISG